MLPHDTEADVDVHIAEGFYVVLVCSMRACLCTTMQLSVCDLCVRNVVQEDAVIAAMDADEPVKHPLLDKVRDCSANPDAAADFFLQILHPYPSRRMSGDAFEHPYVAETCAEMEAYCKDAPVTTPMPYILSVLDEDIRAGELNMCDSHADVHQAHVMIPASLQVSQVPNLQIWEAREQHYLIAVQMHWQQFCILSLTFQ